MKYQRLLPILLPVVLWLFNQLSFWYPGFFYYSLLLGCLLISIGVRLEARSGAIRDWPLFIISPLLIFLSFSFFSSLISNFYWIQAACLLAAWFNFAYFRNLYYYWRYNAPEREDKLDNLLVSGGFLTIFASAASFYSLPAFLSLPTIFLLGIYCPMILLLFGQFLPIRKIAWSSAWPLMLINTLTLLELAWGLTFLPFNFNILAFLLAIFYYFLLTVWRLAWRQALNRHSLQFPIIFSLVLIVILFLTSSWL
jgi:hypothetical protein